jgi:hypothetical protein
LAKYRQIARFIEPMECLPVGKIPEGDLWTYELKLDGYRAIAVKSGGKATVYSRRGTDLTQRFRYLADALANLPDGTVIDGEVVALDEQGKPNFNLLQNYRSAESHIMLYVFDVLVRRGENLTKQTIAKRREIRMRSDISFAGVSGAVTQSGLVSAMVSMLRFRLRLLRWRRVQCRGLPAGCEHEAQLGPRN